MGVFDRYLIAAYELDASDRGEPMDIMSQAMRNAPGRR